MKGALSLAALSLAGSAVADLVENWYDPLVGSSQRLLTDFVHPRYNITYIEDVNLTGRKPVPRNIAGLSSEAKLLSDDFFFGAQANSLVVSLASTALSLLLQSL